MRVAPHALANRNDARRTAIGVWQNAIITHGHPRAHIGALLIAEAVRLAASVESMTLRELQAHLLEYTADLQMPADDWFRVWLREWDKGAEDSYSIGFDKTKAEMGQMLKLAFDTRVEFRQVLNDLGCYKPSTKGSGTACVAAAIAAFVRAPTAFKEQTIRIVNEIGIDTDTIGAMYGALAGARIGSTKIPDEWSPSMQDYEYFLSVADVLTRIATRSAKANYLRVAIPDIRGREHDITELTKARVVSKGQRVLHDLLGAGWVQAVSSTTVRSGGQMLLADVIFDSGQSARFKAFKPKRSKTPKDSIQRTSSPAKQRPLF